MPLVVEAQQPTTTTGAGPTTTSVAGPSTLPATGREGAIWIMLGVAGRHGGDGGGGGEVTLGGRRLGRGPSSFPGW